MEALVASAVAMPTFCGVYLVLQVRTFPVILGLSLLSYAVNIFLFSTGRLVQNMPPILSKYGDASYTDPLPQALVLTAIVISFGMTALAVMIALAAYLSSDTDEIDMIDMPEQGDEQ
jgi:multicomponent K+:H+ antiporter subunit C